MQDPCGQNSIIYGILNIQADYHLTATREEENGLACMVHLEVTCIGPPPLLSSTGLIAYSPRTSKKWISQPKFTLLLEAIGSFEELPAYIIAVAFEQVQPMPWHAWGFTRDAAADD